jgi:translation initiation factor 3 subunit C
MILVSDAFDEFGWAHERHESSKQCIDMWSHTMYTNRSFCIDSEDEIRVVKSAKERYLETFRVHIKNIRSAMKTFDFLTIQSEFDGLTKAMLKAKKILAQGIPRPLVKLLCDLQDFITAQLADKAAFKTLSASQGRALNRLKLTLKKHNKPYMLVMKEYRKNPMSSDDDEESSEEEEEEEAQVSGSEEEEESSDSDEDSEEESSVSNLYQGLYDKVTGMTIQNSHFWDLLNSSFPTVTVHVQNTWSLSKRSFSWRCCI